MPGNDSGAVQVPYTTFLGLNSDLAPGALPEGGSPDNQDVIFLPGEVDSRPCLHKLYPTLGSATITYLKTYVKPDGTPLTLVLDSNGILYKEDVLNAPGVLVQIGTVAPGSYCISVNTNGKEFMAFHDGLHGTDIPRQFDGTNFDRVSQDGPGAAPSIADLTSTVVITSVTLAAGAVITACSGVANGAGLVLLSYTTATPHGLVVGQSMLVQGVAVATYNGVFSVVAVPDSTHVTFTVAGSVPAASSGGTLGLATATMVTATAHGMVAGDAFTFTGNAGTLNTSGVGNPSNWVVASVTNATTLVFNLSNQFGILQGGQATTTGGANGTLAIGGFISPGAHKMVLLFKTRQGFITAPSQPVTWTAIGNKQAQATGIALGPSNVTQRILAFTGAGGSRYWYIPIDVAGGARSTVINDNTTTSLIIDFSDNTLFNAVGIDIPGNNLFNLVTLAPCLSVFSFADRLFWGNEVNKVQAFQNMGFEGGFISGAPTVPLGWTIATAGGAMVTNPVNFGEAWQITGDGTANPKGQISQTGFHDINGIAIIQPNTNYRFRCWAKASGSLLSGTLEAILSSASAAFTSTASIAVSSITTNGLWVQADFSLTTPATIASDLLLQFDVKSLPNGATVTIDELEIIFKDQPYRENDYRVSYFKNPESFDGVTGDLGPESDPTPLRCAGIIRNTMYIVTGDRLHATRDNGQEPGALDGWKVQQIADQCGALSAMCIDGGTSWLTWASDQGLLICEGGSPDKLSQEIQPDWNSINTAVQHRIWLKNDQLTKRIYVGLPTGANTAPNLIYPLDYRELDSEQEIASHGAIHVTFAGRISASELSRKWTRWNLKMHCGNVIQRAGNAQQFVVGSGNGQAPGTGIGFGNAYFLDPAKLTDDDYGQMFPYYISYGFVSHDQEQQMQVGSHRHLYTFISFFVTGVGTIQATPYADVLTNAYPPGPLITMSTSQTFDWMYEINVDASRAFVKFAPAPLANSTDVQFKLTQLVLDVMKHPVSPVR